MASLKYTVDVDTRGARSSIAQLESSLGSLGAAVAGGFAIGNIVAFGDSIVGLQNKLRSLTADQALASSMFNDITRVAGAARAPLQETGDLYFRIARAASDLGITQQQTASITESLAKSMSMTGATAQETSGALLQLGQALQSGRFQGDELRSVLENMPIVSKAMADELGVTIGELRKLGSEGKITSDVFVRAMEKNKKAIDDAFARSVPTAEQALNNLKTAFAVAMTEMAQEEGTPAAALADLAESLLKLTNDIPSLVSAIKDLTSVLLLAGGAMLAFRAHAFLATGGFTVLQGAIATFGKQIGTATAGMFNFGKAGQSVKNGMVGLGTSLGIFDKSRGSIMKTAEGMGFIATTMKRVSQFGLSLTTVFSGILRIGLRLSGIGLVILTIIDVINLLYKAVTGSNEKLIDFASIFKGIITVVRVVFGLLQALGNYIGGVLSPYITSLSNAWNSALTAFMNTGPIRVLGEWIDWAYGKMSAFWNWLKDISGVTAADAAAARDRNTTPDPGRDTTLFGGGGGGGGAATGGGGGGRGGGRSAAEVAREQAEALRDVRKAILEVTKAYREQAATRLEDLNFQLRSLSMSEDQVQIESNRRDIMREQTAALADLATKEEEIRDNKELSNAGRRNALALIEQERQAIQRATQESLAATEATIQAIQAKNIEIERTTKLMELQQKANDNRAVLQGLEDQLSLIGLYGDALEDATAQVQLQQRLREIDVEYQNQLIALENERTRIGEARYAMELANIQALRAQAIESANAQVAAQQRIVEAQRKTERTDVRAAIGKRMEELKRSVDPAITAVEGLNSVFDNMGRAIDNFVDTGKFKFGDFARSVIADIAKIALKAAATKIFTSIFGGIFGRAAGGPVMANKPYLVGEQGPELFVPNSAGSIMTNASLNRNAGTGESVQPVVNNTYITNNISAIDSRSVAQMFVENRKSLLGATAMARKEMPYGT